MPNVLLTAYEVEHELLPAVCARCAEPTTERVPLTVRIIDGWAGVPQIFGILAGLFFFPPLIPLAIRYARSVELHVPLCGPHAEALRRRERFEWRVLLPAWTAVAVVVDLVLIFQLMSDNPAAFCGMPFVVVIVFVAAGLFNARRQVKFTKAEKSGYRLHAVHPAFVEAVIEERARDRVSNPDRRDGHGDVRDDYDDEVT